MRVGSFKKRAGGIVREIRERGKLPILVGGTHYYTQSLVFGDVLVEEGREEDVDGEGKREMSVEEIKRKWPILEESTEDMLQMLREVDPTMADRWHPKDRRKIRRSLEIYLMLGKRASDVYKEQLGRKTFQNADDTDEGGEDLSSTLFFWVHAESSVLKKRLDDRVHKMLENGMLDEIKSMDQFLQPQSSLTGQTIDRTRGIWVSIGYKEFEPYLQALKSPTTTEASLKSALDLSVEQTQAATRQYAKRQQRWIRLKLLPALLESNALQQLYLLDGTDISEWENHVSGPAMKITEEFLAGREMQDPKMVCEAAREVLGEHEVKGKKSEWPRRECEVCGVVTVTEVQWETHLKSRKHRGALKRLAKRERDGRVRGVEIGENGGPESKGTP